MTTPVTATILEALAARAAGAPEVLDELWAPRSTSWRSYDGRETTLDARQRQDLARSEWSLFRQAMPDFTWTTELQPVGDGSQILELASWHGTNGTDNAAVELCLIYRLTDQRIARIEMYCDAQQMLALRNILHKGHNH